MSKSLAQVLEETFTRCRVESQFSEGLTPAEKASELRAMELHVLEWERMGLEEQ